MTSIAPTEIVRCLHRIKERGHLETAQRVREAVQHVYHYAAITDPKQFAQLLRDIQAYKSHVITRVALQLMPMLFQRPGQLRLADWEDVDFEQEISALSV